MNNDISLYACAFAVDEVVNGELYKRGLPKEEYCLCLNGNYYNLFDFKRYKLANENHKIDEEYIIKAVKVDEEAFKTPEDINVYNILLKIKQKLRNHVEEERKNAENIEDYLQNIPCVHLMIYDVGVVVDTVMGLSLKKIYGQKCVAFLIDNVCYDIMTGEEIPVLSDKNLPGDEVGYNFKGIAMEDLEEPEYKDLLLRASMLIKKVKGDSKVYTIG